MHDRPRVVPDSAVDLYVDSRPAQTARPMTPWPVVPQPLPAPPERRRRRWLAPLLFALTCITTFLVGGPVYAAAVITILGTHELGHFVQARRYGVDASWPYFIPMPLPPLGTMGAVIVMRERMRGVRALFDIGISGPLAGLVPALIFTVVGLFRSEIQPIPEDQLALYFGEPLLFQALSYLILGPVPEGSTVFIGPLAMAGWVGIFITALNLLPIGQLDGGHILYALLRRRSYTIVRALMAGIVAAVILGQYWQWSLLVVLLLFFGPLHPPTRNDHEPLGRTRRILGWATLAFVFVGFTPIPWTVTTG